MAAMLQNGDPDSHQSGEDYFLFTGIRVVSGLSHECPILYEMVDQFVEAVGKGVMKRLILDRGFLDGEKISHCKKDHGIDVLIPVRSNMDIFKDAEALFQLPEVDWTPLEQADSKPKQEPARPRHQRELSIAAEIRQDAGGDPKAGVCSASRR